MAVLRRTELESSPLADLHAIASELGLEGYRTKRKDDLVVAILAAQGEEAPAAVEEEPEPEPAPSTDDDSAPPSDDDSAPASEEAAPAPDEALADDPLVASADDFEPDEVPSDETLEAPPGTEVAEPAGEEEPEVVEDEASDEEIATGMLDILSNGSGFLRLDPDAQSRGDVYVSPAQIRRCELRSGDEVSGPVRPPRRNERHPSLVRVESVNGTDAEPPEERPWFGDLTPVYPTERLAALGAPDSVPFGKGSRVAVAGAPGAGATTLLREIAKGLAERHTDVTVQVVLAGVRPEEIAEWRATGLPVIGDSFDRPTEAHAQAAELAVERAKRVVERGGHAAVVIDSLDALPPGARRRVFGAGRATGEGGTLTVVAAVGEDREPLRWATTRVALSSGSVDEAASGTLRADALG